MIRREFLKRAAALAAVPLVDRLVPRRPKPVAPPAAVFFGGPAHGMTLETFGDSAAYLSTVYLPAVNDSGRGEAFEQVVYDRAPDPGPGGCLVYRYREGSYRSWPEFLAAAKRDPVAAGRYAGLTG